MTNFIQYFYEGKFVITYCRLCKKNIWPPMKNCPHCLNKTSKKFLKNSIGTLLDFSYSMKDSAFFGIVEMHDIKLVGEILFESKSSQEKMLKIHYGMKLKLIYCGKKDNTDELFFRFVPI